MKVLIISNIPSPYRVSFFNYLINNYKEKTIEVLYSSKNEDNRKWTIDEELNNTSFLSSRTIKLKYKYDDKYIHIPKNVFKTLNNIKPEVIVASEYNITAVLSFLWCKIYKKKYICWSDGTLNSEKNINFIQKSLRKLVCKKSNAFIASSSKTKEAQIFYGAKEKIFVSHLTIDVVNKLYTPVRNNQTVKLLYVGSLIKRKGVDLLLDSIKDIQENYILNIVGDGTEKNNLLEFVKQHNLGDKVNFLGYLEGKSLIEQYKSADAFILPTREDCFGLVVTEAMCCSLPIIISKYSDAAYDLIEEEENGYIIDPYDMDSFKEAIEKILKNKDLRNKFSSNSYKKIKNFSFENVSKEFIGAIDYATKK